jgi:hypothetical protein
LGQALQPNLRLLGITLQKNLTFLDFNFFKIQKIIDPRHRAGHVTSSDYISTGTVAGQEGSNKASILSTASKPLAE